MTIRFKDPEPPRPASLAQRLGADGRLVFLKQSGGFWITAEDNDPEMIQVHVAVKRRQVVYYDEAVNYSDDAMEMLKRIKIPTHIQVQFS